MKRIIQFSLLLCLCSLHLNAQTASEGMPEMRRNSIFLEGSGNGIAYTINYDHLFSLKKKPMMGIGGRIGYFQGTYPWIFGMASTRAVLPLEVFYSYGIKSCLELGLGYTFIFKDHRQTEGMIIIRSSYKYRGPKGFIFGIGAIARIEYYGIVLPIPHLSIGFSF